MNRDIHDIYDVILKIACVLYGTKFLNYIGINGKIKQELNREIVTINGNKRYVDFLAEMENDTISHVEFQYPCVKIKDLDRFFDYNIFTQTIYEKLTETLIICFTKKSKEIKRKIGQTKLFCPKFFYIGDINFDEKIKNINIKLKSNEQLTDDDEITLILMCLVPECENRYEKLKKICELLKNEKLFDEKKLELIKGIIKLEIDNLLTKEERKKIRSGMKMSPESLAIITKAIDEVNKKVISEAEMDGIEKGIEKGIKQGMEKGMEKGRKDTTEKIAKALKNQIDIQTLSQATRLSIEEIENL